MCHIFSANMAFRIELEKKVEHMSQRIQFSCIMYSMLKHFTGDFIDYEQFNGMF